MERDSKYRPPFHSTLRPPAVTRPDLTLLLIFFVSNKSSKQAAVPTKDLDSLRV